MVNALDEMKTSSENERRSGFVNYDNSSSGVPF